jgi:hypothetical protein
VSPTWPGEREGILSTTTCAKCGGVVRLDRPSCPACGAARVAMTTVTTSLATAYPPRREDMAIRIRSRLMWGDDPAEIRGEFVKLGARPAEVDALMRTAVQERENYYRALGLKNVIAGAALAVLGSAMLLCVHLFFSGAAKQLPIWFMFAGIALPAGGIVLAVKGVRRMLRPGEGESTAHGDVEGR